MAGHPRSPSWSSQRGREEVKGRREIGGEGKGHPVLQSDCHHQC